MVHLGGFGNVGQPLSFASIAQLKGCIQWLTDSFRLSLREALSSSSLLAMELQPMLKAIYVRWITTHVLQSMVSKFSQL